MLLRILLLVIAIWGTMWVQFHWEERTLTLSLGLLAVVGIVIELFRYSQKTNRLLKDFFESVKYQDYAIQFSSNYKKDTGLVALQQTLENFIFKLKDDRAEQEAYQLSLEFILNQIQTGILVYDEKGKIILSNHAAGQYLQVKDLHLILELEKQDYQWWNTLVQSPVGKKVLLTQSHEQRYSVLKNEIRLRGEKVNLVVIQNIYSELQQKEIESWQKLTSVLRHEIINSISPIMSLSDTLIEILELDSEPLADGKKIDDDTFDDLNESLAIISKRSKGLVNFLDEYRDYTSLPKPEFEETYLDTLLQDIVQLVKTEMQEAKVSLIYTCDSPKLKHHIDQEKVEMVLINLLKNARQAVKGNEQAEVRLTLGFDTMNRPLIEVEDNGCGIVEEAISKVFLPFYSTKKDGSGIGLYLSKQIMQLHNGEISVKSEYGKGTVFSLKF
ncbi:histidine kinase/DNA gyrase B/HSP90-like ATPase [Sediminitomix flava]|uniref:histidine kinase n=2 Tax=Sediminitomix flava TaxID=379075 RepID=A0A315Z2J4_SEDFL|nr:histidine kinase/DNA gyrase B/HSP90-like ATPase [Sediminitomix flava]